MKELAPGLYRILIPFENIYTTAFVLTAGRHYLIADSGSSAEDVKNYILPAAAKIGPPTAILCSHDHGDHAGGFPALQNAFPDAVIGNPGDVLFDRFQILPLPGHSPDSLGVFDLETRFLFSFDSLQEYGISRYGIAVRDYAAYRETLDSVRALLPEAIITSHDYYPDGFRAEGREAVEHYIEKCEEAVDLLACFAADHCDLDSRQVAELFALEYPDYPRVADWCVRAARGQTV